MKLVFQQSDLAKSVNIVMKAIPTRTTMPILECILIDAATNTIRFTANDMELGIETVVKGEVVEKGRIALDARLLSDIVKKLPDAKVVIETDQNDVAEITCEKSRFSVPGRNADEFALLPAIEKDESITISQFTLKEIVRQTLFSVAMNDNNRLMTGELFEIGGGRLKVVALDGHRIAIRRVEYAGECGDKKVVVPGKTLGEISKILSGESEDKVNIYFSENHILFEFDETVVLSRLIDGEYFRIDQMLSTGHETEIKINRQNFINIIDRATLLIRESDKMPVVLVITDEGMELKITTVLGSMNEETEIEKTGKDITIGFNPKFLLDALRAIDDEEVSLFFINAKAPCFIRDAEDNYIYLVLPVNLR